jgi:putative endonuclease
MCYFVYILYSKTTDTFYRGQTKNLPDRIRRHNSKLEKATKHGTPWILVWNTLKENRAMALSLERKLKNLSRKRIIDFIIKYNNDSRALTFPDFAGQGSQDADP